MKYDQGHMVKRDYAKSVEWFRRSALQGNADSQCNLGVRYAAGNGIDQDYGKALEWYVESLSD